MRKPENLGKECFSNKIFFRLSSGVQPKDVAQCVMQGVVLLPLEIHPPKPFNVQLQEVSTKQVCQLVAHPA